MRFYSTDEITISEHAD